MWDLWDGKPDVGPGTLAPWGEPLPLKLPSHLWIFTAFVSDPLTHLIMIASLYLAAENIFATL